MIPFLKSILKGLLYVLFFPLGLISICVYAAFGFFVFLFQTGKLIYIFFTGRGFKNELPEDIEARKILEANAPKLEKEPNEPALSLYPSDSDLYNTEYESPSFPDKEVEEEPNEEEGGDL